MTLAFVGSTRTYRTTGKIVDLCESCSDLENHMRNFIPLHRCIIQLFSVKTKYQISTFRYGVILFTIIHKNKRTDKLPVNGFVDIYLFKH